MNNIYVDELPKCCEQCQINCSKKLKAKFSCLVTDCDGCIGSKSKNCPLKLLSTRLAEERKKVCDELRRKAEDKYFEIGEDGEIPCGWVISEERLQQIERGE